MLPGAGPTVASFLSYTVEKKVSKHPEEFGKGAIEGVAGPESANNAAATAAMVPMLTLGIPGSATTAIMLGGLMMWGLRPGPLLFELSLTLPPLAQFQAACEAPLGRAARRTRGVAFLYLRSGADFVCAARVGATSLKGLSIHIGTRRPLVTSSGGVAILVALPHEESCRIIAENMKRVARFGELRIKSIERMIHRSREHGYGINLGDVVPGINSFSIAICDPQGAPFASLCVSGAAEDFPAREIPKVMAVLESEKAQIAAKMPVWPA